MSPRRSSALTVLRLADRGRISSLSFNRRRTGLPPSESVSSWYPSWMCESRSCSVSVSFGRRLAVFFFTLFTSIGAEVSFPILPVEAPGKRLGSKPHTAATAETTDDSRANRRVSGWQPRGRQRSAASCPALRRCAPAARLLQWSDQRPSDTISNRRAQRSIRSDIRYCSVLSDWSPASRPARADSSELI